MYAMLGNYISQGVYTVAGPFHPFGGAVDIIVVQQEDGTFKSSPWYVKFGKFQGVLKRREKIVDVAVNDIQANFHMYLDHKGDAYFLKDVESDCDDNMLSPPSAPSSGDEIVEFRGKGDARIELELDGREARENLERLEGVENEVADTISEVTGDRNLANSLIIDVEKAEKIGLVSNSVVNPTGSDVVSGTESILAGKNTIETENKAKALAEWQGNRSESSSNAVSKPARSIFGRVFGGMSQRGSPISVQKGNQLAADDLHRLSSLERAEIVADLLDRNWGIRDKEISLTATNMVQINLSANCLGFDGPQSANCLEASGVASDQISALKTEELGELAQEILEAGFEGRQDEDANVVNTVAEDLDVSTVRFECSAQHSENVEANLPEDWYLRTTVEEDTMVLLLDARKLSKGNLGEKIYEDEAQNSQYEDMGATMIESVVTSAGDFVDRRNNSEVVLMSVDGHIMMAPVISESDLSRVEEPAQGFHNANTIACAASPKREVREEISESENFEHFCGESLAMANLSAGLTRKEQNVSKAMEPVRIKEVTADSLTEKKDATTMKHVLRTEVFCDPTREQCGMTHSESETGMQVPADPRLGSDSLQSSAPVLLTVAAHRTHPQHAYYEQARAVMLTDTPSHSTSEKNDVLKFRKHAWLSEGSVDFTMGKPCKYGCNELEIANSAQGEPEGSEFAQPLMTSCLIGEPQGSRRGQLNADFFDSSVITDPSGDHYMVSKSNEFVMVLDTWEKQQWSGCGKHIRNSTAADTSEGTPGFVEGRNACSSAQDMSNTVEWPSHMEVGNSNSSGRVLVETSTQPPGDHSTSEVAHTIMFPLQVELSQGEIVKAFGQTGDSSGGVVLDIAEQSSQFGVANNSSSGRRWEEPAGQLGIVRESKEGFVDGSAPPSLDHFHSFSVINNSFTEFEHNEGQEDLFKCCLSLENLSPATDNVEEKDSSGACSSIAEAQSKALKSEKTETVRTSESGDQQPAADVEDQLRLTKRSNPMAVPQKSSGCWEEGGMRVMKNTSSSLPASIFETEKLMGEFFYSRSVGADPLLNTLPLPDAEDTGELMRHSPSSTNHKEICVSGEVLGFGTIAGKSEEDIAFGGRRDFGENIEALDGGIGFKTGIEISLCRHLLTEGMGTEAAANAFESEKVSLDEFTRSGSAIVANDKLVVKVGENFFPWAFAAPLILGMAAFGTTVTSQMKGAIAVQANEKTRSGKIAAGTVVPPSGGWRLWPFTFRRARTEKSTHSSSSATSNVLWTATQAAVRSPFTKELLQKNGYYSRPWKSKVSTNVPTSLQLASLNLKEGPNKVTFTFSTRVLGKQEVDARIYLWKWNTRIVVSDVDGTITKSDVLGQVMPLVGRDWSQSGVTRLFSAIKDNGYEMLFLSARAISQAYLTRQFLLNLKQDGEALPDGPVVISPDGLLPSFYREVIRRAPHEFKISCLEGIRELFPPDVNPFYAGFGNRDTDEISYLKVGIPKGKIFIINPKGEVAVNHRVDVKSYTSLHILVDEMFPAMSSFEQEDFNSWNYWKLPLPDINDELNEKR